MQNSALQEEGTIVEFPGDPRDADEQGWLDRAQQGDRSGFEKLYRAHVGRVHALCLRMTGQTPVAEEMSQEVFLRAWKKLSGFTDAAHFRAWLSRVAVNLVLNQRRQWVRRKAQENWMDTASGTSDDSFDARPVAGARLDLEKAIAKLPDGARLVLLLHDVHGFQHQEISEMTGRAVGTTKAQLHRARKRLREVMAR